MMAAGGMIEWILERMCRLPEFALLDLLEMDSFDSPEGEGGGEEEEEDWY